jgi:hypothetical protein
MGFEGGGAVVSRFDACGPASGKLALTQGGDDAGEFVGARRAARCLERDEKLRKGFEFGGDGGAVNVAGIERWPDGIRRRSMREGAGL